MNLEYLSLCDFNYDIYRQHKDLQAMTNGQLVEHFLTFGINEGRTFNAIQNRKDFVAHIDKKGKMLEIGPLGNPQLNHRSPNFYDILQLYYEKNVRPRFGDVLRKVSQGIQNDPIAHWNNNHDAISPETALVENYAGFLKQYNSGTYIDSHVNLFTPQSFMRIIAILNQLN